jgi:hypothetical protein
MGNAFDAGGGHADPQLVEVFRGIRRDSREGDGSIPTAVMVAPEFVIDGGGSVIVTGSAGGLIIPFPCRITQVELQEFEGTSGTITVDIQTAVPGAAPSFASICASAKPTISPSGRYYLDSTLSGWSTTIARHTAMQFLVNAVTLFTRITVVVTARRLDLTG